MAKRVKRIGVNRRFPFRMPGSKYLPRLAERKPTVIKGCKTPAPAVKAHATGSRRVRTSLGVISNVVRRMWWMKPLVAVKRSKIPLAKVKVEITAHGPSRTLVKFEGTGFRGGWVTEMR
ncbi:hypothetical protein M422DRAFT_41994 [Sphaerobolus stellatus SS14]|nr:hypothetical protein M422DRAFT_41994 [Sphaerobolus stellatus SS14]